MEIRGKVFKCFSDNKRIAENPNLFHCAQQKEHFPGTWKRTIHTVLLCVKTDMSVLKADSGYLAISLTCSSLSFISLIKSNHNLQAWIYHRGERGQFWFSEPSIWAICAPVLRQAAVVTQSCSLSIQIRASATSVWKAFPLQDPHPSWLCGQDLSNKMKTHSFASLQKGFGQFKNVSLKKSHGKHFSS